MYKSALALLLFAIFLVVSSSPDGLNGMGFPEECTYGADKGPCRAYMPRFFYNTLTNECERFFYGGCKGNANNFRTYADCAERCSPSLS
uniref:BPTI/Kunitz inhibitor domain-containing protein n=1 Tax=Amblyomma triste TaxID=251400 RepID=A0A023GNX8_AMBTT